MARITIVDVAKAAGVSTTTVSHVVNDTRYVAPETKARVIKTLAELGYEPNILARSLRNGITKTIGLVVPDASNPFFAEVARKIEDIGFLKGYSVILCNSDNNTEKQSSYIDMLLNKQVDGVILISSDSRPDDINRLVRNNTPLVVADREVPLQVADLVLLDNEQAGYDATKHLVDLGHRAIACISGPYNLSPSMQRVNGYKRCLSEHGIDIIPEYLISGDFGTLSGSQATERLLAMQPRPTAVFALNDMMAFGVISRINSAGLQVPADIAVVGFDNIELSSVIMPSLTTMAQPINEIAEVATGLLLDRLHGQRGGGNQRVILRANLLPRQSTQMLTN